MLVLFSNYLKHHLAYPSIRTNILLVRMLYHSLDLFKVSSHILYCNSQSYLIKNQYRPYREEDRGGLDSP